MNDWKQVCVHIESTYTESGRMYCIPIHLVYKTPLLPLEPIIRSVRLCVSLGRNECLAHMDISVVLSTQPVLDVHTAPSKTVTTKTQANSLANSWQQATWETAVSWNNTAIRWQSWILVWAHVLWSGFSMLNSRILQTFWMPSGIYRTNLKIKENVTVREGLLCKETCRAKYVIIQTIFGKLENIFNYLITV